MQAATSEGMVFAAGRRRRVRLTEFLPAFDAMASPLQAAGAAGARPAAVSELAAELPELTIVHHTVPCPWALKGLVMRVLTERLDRPRTRSDGTGSRCSTNGGWGMVLPDPVEPLVHVLSEGDDRRGSRSELERSCTPVDW